MYALLTITFLALVSVAPAQEGSSDKETPPPSWIVVLKDGRKLPARTKPVSAFGNLRYMQPDGTNRVLSVSQVDLDKTRMANAEIPSRENEGTLSTSGALAISSDASPTPAAAEKPRNQTVTVYSATWCPYCRQLKKFLAENGISASITEVDRLPAAEQERAEAEMKRLTGKVSYPTVVIGNSVKAGFSPQWILKSLEG